MSERRYDFSIFFIDMGKAVVFRRNIYVYCCISHVIYFNKLNCEEKIDHEQS
jgi:hypothetical protein